MRETTQSSDAGRVRNRNRWLYGAGFGLAEGLWVVAAAAFIAATVAVAARLGRPAPLAIEIPDFGDVEDLSIERIGRHVKAMSSAPSRVTGYDGCDQALEYILGQLDGLGVGDVEIESFEVAVPMVEYAVLEARTPEGLEIIPLHPLWPNLVRTSQTVPEGIAAPLVDVAGGSDQELRGKVVRGALVVMDSASEAEWLRVQEFGGAALLFRASDSSTGYQARKKFVTVPANVPRFYVDHEHLDALDDLLTIPGQTATIRCRMGWRNVVGKNVFARLVQGDAAEAVSGDGGAPIVFHTYYDGISVVPTLAPGAEQACGAAALLELARFLRNLPERPPRPLYLLFTGGHGQALAGITHFVRRLDDGLEHGWGEQDRNSLVARMGRPGLMVGLDLSSHSNRMGVFCVGGFRGQYEHTLRPKFSKLGLKLAHFAKGFMTDYYEVAPDEIPPETVKSFVDAINPALGRGWWTYFPYRAAFESEIPTMAGLPAVTLSTINDGRRYVDTPEDTFEHLDLDLLDGQLTYKRGERVGLARLALAFAYWKGPFVGAELEPKMSKVQGQVTWLNSETDYVASSPLSRAVVALKTFRNDKHLMGTRGVPVVIADEQGRFEFDGLIDVTANAQFNHVELEAYGVATEPFIEANRAACAQFLRVLAKGGRPAEELVADGRIIYAVDWARPNEQRWFARMRNEVEHVSLVTFPSKPITLYGLTEPRAFLALTHMQILDAATESPPFQYGHSLIDSWWGDPEENCMCVWADPTLRVRLTLGFGMKERRLILVNNSLEDPIGRGYVLSDLETIPSWVLQGALSMWFLDADRIGKFGAHGVANPRVASLHQESRQNLETAQGALARSDYAGYRAAAERGWALETAAYNELLATANNMIKGVLFYLILLIPFSYCLERLVFASGTIHGRIMGMVGIFAVSFAILAIIHPAFRFTLTPLLVLLAFLILVLSAGVSLFVLRNFDAFLRERKQAVTGIHEDTVALSNVAVRAVELGIANIRRRPQRAFFTGLTIVLVTFTLLSFISVVPEVGITRLRHRQGVPVYAGLLTRHPNWHALPNPLYESLRRGFVEGVGESLEGNVVCGRAWYCSDFAGNATHIDLTPVAEHPQDQGESLAERTFTAVSLLGLESREGEITPVTSTLEAGRWFQDNDEQSIILPDHIARHMGYGADDLGKRMRVFGQELTLVGIVDGEQFDALRDIDGEPLTPVNLGQTQLEDAQRTQVQEIDTLKEYVHWGSNQVAIVPFELARRWGATTRSVAIKTGRDVDPNARAESFVRGSNLAILASHGGQVTLYAAMNRSRLTGAGQIFIPLLLGFIMVLGAMLGSVYERRREIFVYNCVGLSPTNVSWLFLAESGVYAILGGCAGYLFGQVASKLLMMTGMLPGLSLNYSAGSAVLVAALTMGIVLVSTLYPARQAFQAAVPEKRKHFEAIEGGIESGYDRISIFLPFVAARDSVFAMQAYMAEFLDGVQGVSVGQLAVDNLRAGVETHDGTPSPTLHFRAWLAPFDLGISHDAELSVRYRADRDIYQYHLTAVHRSGDQQNWKRMTPWFILAVRRQLLMWRVIPGEDQEAYNKKAAALFGVKDHEVLV